MASFAHLHVHSHYSLLQALSKVPDLIAVAKENGWKTLTLTDRGNLYGAIDFYKECTKAGIKPIIGVDLALEGGCRLVLLAKNHAGYQNLLALITEINLSGGEEHASLQVPWQKLEEHTEDLIAIIPSQNGEISAALRARDETRAKEFIKRLRPLFKKDDLYLGLSFHEEIEGHDALMRLMREFAEKEGIPLVADQESYYVKPEDRRAWITMRAVDNRGPQEEGEIGSDEEDYSLLSNGEMEERFAELPEALKNSEDIAERCNLELTIGKFVFPEYPLPPGKSADDALRELCFAGLTRRGLGDSQAARERLEYELGIIKFKGYAAYFLVVEDLIRFARENGILTNIRGSVAGSMTTYTLYITKIDPLVYNIPFERFLNPERPSAPDIDMDYADNRRDEVIDYARRKYGEDHVAQIGTFGTMLARGVVRDVARALGYPYGVGDRIAKGIPMGSQGFPMTLDRALEETPDLAEMYKKEKDVKEIIDLGKKIEGCVRHISVHAAGVVISPAPLQLFTPLQRDPKGGKIITQYDMYSVGEDGVGLTKFDFLGIRNLTILGDAVKLVEKTRGVKIDIDEVPLDDKKTFEMLARGETEGTFQLNGDGMTKWLVELKPSTIHDINAMVALYRPGPMQFIPDYIRRKHDPSLISYLDPALEPILRQSYGILVYQDDMLLMANQLAGYSWGEVDKFRKAVGKKIPEEMAKQKDKFIQGCVKHSKWSLPKAQKVWAWLEPFAAYGFNKAHSASYGKVAYQTAYLKANYPVEYMSAVLTNEAGNIETVAIMVAECKRMKIPVLPPDVNESYGVFTVVLGSDNKERTEEAAALAGDAKEDAIRFGLYSVKNLGEGVADAIIGERKKGGRFTSLSDFLRRVKEQSLNKKALEALIQCGALDSLGERGMMLANLEHMLEYHRSSAIEQPQDSLFASLGEEASDIKLLPAPEAPMNLRLEWEKELLGLYVSGHPLDRVKETLAKRPMTIPELRMKLHPGMETVTAGIIEEARTILTRGGDQMCFIKIADYHGSIEAVLFPKVYAECKLAIKADACIALKGRLSNRNGEFSLVAEKVKAI